jgi:hypothetical protein
MNPVTAGSWHATVALQRQRFLIRINILKPKSSDVLTVIVHITHLLEYSRAAQDKMALFHCSGHTINPKKTTEMFETTTNYSSV